MKRVGPARALVQGDARLLVTALRHIGTENPSVPPDYAAS